MSNINVEEHLGMVWDVIDRDFKGGRNLKFMGFDPEDLFQIGVIGLMKAVERFDEGRGFKFSTYASHLIAGEIKHEIRDHGRLVRFPRKAVGISVNIAKQGRKDSIKKEEIMSEFGVGEEFAEIVFSCLLYNPMSGDKSVSDDEGETSTSVFDLIGDDSIDVEDEATTSIELEQRLSILDERERLVVELSLEGMSQKQVGEVIGVSQMHVSRLLKKSLKKIEEMFDKEFAV